ncbi:hypothetical protein ONE63_006288 [Megalurothrips usitatus]|uniref:Uncharacterized protein n=1 Tax=Megalurothrips usitatus TaxID=439358 RepID=A0AAV7XZU5_9NEOP|nr:hypothetical protein ONE63_006288 [Megalurothrips usitatus]
MDSSCSEVGDGSARLSLSLVSYGSDDEDVDPIIAISNRSSETLMPDLHIDVSQPTGCTLPSSADENEFIMCVAEQLGLSGVSPGKLNQLSFAVERMEAAQQKYIRSKLLLDSVANVSKAPSKLPSQTSQRVNKVLDHITLLDYAAPCHPDITEGIFGISSEHLAEHLPNELTATDYKHLKEAVETELAIKHEKLVLLSKRSTDILSKASGPAIGIFGNHAEKNSTHELLSLQKDLNCEISINEKLLEDMDKILSAQVKLKLESFYHINLSRVQLYNNRCEVLKNDIRVLNDKISNGIYLEDEHLINAHTVLKKSLDVAVTEAKLKLSEYQKKEAEYNKLRGTHFDRLVREYCDLKEKIAQKEYALNNLL